MTLPNGDCGDWWLFDATGALVAEGGGCNTTDQCTGAVAGLQFPYQCFENGGWAQEVNLCAGAGVDAGIFDAAVDASGAADGPAD